MVLDPLLTMAQGVATLGVAPISDPQYAYDDDVTRNGPIRGDIGAPRDLHIRAYVSTWYCGFVLLFGPKCGPPGASIASAAFACGISADN